jgi:hypothetical protein
VDLVHYQPKRSASSCHRRGRSRWARTQRRDGRRGRALVRPRVELPAPITSFADAAEAAAQYRRASRSDNTRRAYRAAVARFCAWCAQMGYSAVGRNVERRSGRMIGTVLSSGGIIGLWRTPACRHSRKPGRTRHLSHTHKPGNSGYFTDNYKKGTPLSPEQSRIALCGHCLAADGLRDREDSRTRTNDPRHR